jgi:choice-of-anchor C domain-containing protein
MSPKHLLLFFSMHNGRGVIISMRTTKKWFRRLFTAAVAVGMMTAAGMVTAAPAQATTGLVDGSFENPVLPAGSGFQRLFAPATMGAWTVTQGSVDLSAAGFWQNADGNQSLDLDGAFDPGGVAQTFNTVPLLKYRVTYALAGNPASGPIIKTGKVLADGATIQHFSFDITGKNFTNMGYVYKHTYFIATGFSSTLEFRSTTGSGYGPVIDDVDVDSCLLVICL